jgi:hypothetical protein
MGQGNLLLLHLGQSLLQKMLTNSQWSIRGIIPGQILPKLDQKTLTDQQMQALWDHLAHQMEWETLLTSLDQILTESSKKTHLDQLNMSKNL